MRTINKSNKKPGLEHYLNKSFGRTRSLKKTRSPNPRAAEISSFEHKELGEPPRKIPIIQTKFVSH